MTERNKGDHVLNVQYLLIDSQIENENDVSTPHGRFIPYGLTILNEALKSNSYKGRLLLEQEEYEAYINSCGDQGNNIKLIGIGSSTITRFDAKRKIEQCRNKYPHSIIVAGGNHFGNCAEDALSHIPQLDIVVRGEADEVIVQLMKYAFGEMELKSISGISYRDNNGTIISSGPRLVVEKLPDISFIEQFYSMDRFINNPLSADMPIPAMNILAGRGCPYNCIFCSVNRTKNRRYQVDDIVNIIERTIKKYGIKGVKFYDDALTLNDLYTESLCNELMKRKLDILWWCDSRANINLDLLPLMYSAGCRYISVGLETGSPRIQKIVGKNITNDQIMNFTEKCNEAGISTYVFLMASFPDETPQDLEMTIDIARDLSRKCRSIAGSMGAAVILPGTQLETIARQRGILANNFSWHEPYYEPLNIQYDVSPIMPLYREGISPEIFKKAKQKMLANYANSLDCKTFIRNAIENVMRYDISWEEKFAVATQIIKGKIKSIF